MFVGLSESPPNLAQSRSASSWSDLWPCSLERLVLLRSPKLPSCGNQYPYVTLQPHRPMRWTRDGFLKLERVRRQLGFKILFLQRGRSADSSGLVADLRLQSCQSRDQLIRFGQRVPYQNPHQSPRQLRYITSPPVLFVQVLLESHADFVVSQNNRQVAIASKSGLACPRPKGRRRECGSRQHTA